jgi:hypothetical protein
LTAARGEAEEWLARTLKTFLSVTADNPFAGQYFGRFSACALVLKTAELNTSMSVGSQSCKRVREGRSASATHEFIRVAPIDML